MHHLADGTHDEPQDLIVGLRFQVIHPSGQPYLSGVHPTDARTYCKSGEVVGLAGRLNRGRALLLFTFTADEYECH